MDDDSSVPQSIDVVLERSHVFVDGRVFALLLSNSVVYARVPYRRALENGEIHFNDLVKLARDAEIPYSLFFAPLPFVEAQLHAKDAKLLEGVTKETFSLNSRDNVELRQIELIVKDLLRKQQLLKQVDDTLTINPIMGLLRKESLSITEDAEKLLDALDLTREDIYESRKKENAFDLIVDKLEARQILVSQSSQGYMPQQLKGIRFSGITIKDRKVPYIFLAGGDQGDYQEPAGRRIFTIMLLTVLVARSVFAPVTYDGHSTKSASGREYRLVEQLLMPVEKMKKMNVSSLDTIKDGSNVFQATPSALVIRALHLSMIGLPVARGYLDALADEYNHRPSHPFNQAKPVTGVRKYAGREFSLRRFDALDAGKISAGDFFRVVSFNRLSKSQISDYREALH